MRRKALYALAIVALAQLAQPDRTAPVHDPTLDLLAMTHPNEEVERLLVQACGDCHSDRTRHPWYAYITPVNFWLQHHVNEGRAEFNMSAWGEKSAKWRDHKKKEALHELKEEAMPLPSYTLLHPEARLTAEQRQLLLLYFQGVQP